MHIDGNVSRDVVGGDQTVTQTAGGDIVGGDKITHTGAGHIFAGSGDVLVVQPQLSPAGARDRANLLLLLNKVRTFWIEGVLERSAHSALLLELGREMRAEAVDHPWSSVVELPDALRRPLPADVSHIQVFDEANRALLILGEPGSGKTTTLLEIARDLIVRAETDVTQPIPVVFNLSSWIAQRRGLGAWLAAELAARYRVPPAIGRRWLAEHRLLPLLDGLDEVAPASQSACVKAVNDYIHTHGLAGLIVCCRSEEYLRLPVRLRLNAAISISPLTSVQIDAYLQAGGDSLAGLRAAIRTDNVLAVLAQTPLFLSIMCLAYQNLEPASLTDPALNTLDQRRRQLFDQYVVRMLKRKGQSPGRFSDSKLLGWLSWLARQMAENNQTVFMSERMQPSWLDSAHGRWAYALASRIGMWVSLGFGLAVSSLVVWAMFETEAATWPAYLALTLSGAAWMARLSELVGSGLEFAGIGLVAGLICGVRFARAARMGGAHVRPDRTVERVTRNLAFTTLLPVLVLHAPGLAAALALPEAAHLLTVWTGGMLLRIVSAAIALRGWRSGDSLSRDIPTVDTLDWSGPQALKGAVAGFLVTAVLVSGCILAASPQIILQDRLFGAAFWAMATGLLGSLAGGVIGGLRGQMTLGTPDAGHWVARQVGIALRAGLISGLAVAVVVAALALLIFFVVEEAIGTRAFWRATLSGLGLGLSCGLISGSVAALYFGGAGLVQRAVLRMILVLQRRTPWRISRIADQAEDLVFLRRVGGGYIFIHRLVLEYFATLRQA